MRSKILLTCLLPMNVFLCAPATQSYAEAEVAREVVHSDLPLFGDDGENIWPHAFESGDTFGCLSRVAFGDWVLREPGRGNDDDALWYRVRNYGVFHCSANVASSYGRRDFERVGIKRSFFVLLETIRIRSQPIELWVVQMSNRAGSDYLLLSRAPGGGLVDRFNVLQTRCPRANIRDAAPLDIIRTRHCAINTEAELRRFARRMARLPPRGTLMLVDAREGHNE